MSVKDQSTPTRILKNLVLNFHTYDNATLVAGPSSKSYNSILSLAQGEKSVFFDFILADISAHTTKLLQCYYLLLVNHCLRDNNNNNTFGFKFTRGSTIHDLSFINSIFVTLFIF